MTLASFPKPTPPAMATVNSLIISPACLATIVAPTILSLPLAHMHLNESLLFTINDGTLHLAHWFEEGIKFDSFISSIFFIKSDMRDFRIRVGTPTA